MAPRFDELMRAEERVLKARVEAVRATLDHSGEKGRVLESGVQSLLRSWLPLEYGLGTGFIARPTADESQPVELSGQLDVIIYDAMRFGPLARFDTCEVYPIEAVLGYVEVKATLRREMESIVATAARLRGWKERRFLSYARNDGGDKRQTWAMNAFVFAYEYDVGVPVPEDIDVRLSDLLARAGPDASLSSVYVDATALWSRVPAQVTPGKHEMNKNTEHGLALFKWRMLLRLTECRRMPPEWLPHLGLYDAWQPRR